MVQGIRARAFSLHSGTGFSLWIVATSTYIRVWQLGLLLLAAAVVSLALTANLFNNLKPGAYMHLFMQLVQWRQVLHFALGMECVLWYYWSLNELKRQHQKAG